ncbi:VWA domain-containing protein [Parafrankia sp. EUN1f]|uniref:vWA domain-containing protein n=1 Tax=Parafrankia sp. EUN1f TaxID=102897 RepID=UPI0001C442C4|nr:VWA domain-containing protein [Parafrankia sp. EUN1f]EFC84853.1 von Willebrand factor type A [Parafrankia sp. EUN1f]
MSSGQFRYGPWDGGPDPLASPFSATDAVDEMSHQILEGRTPREALDTLLRRGMPGRRGLDDLRRAIERRRREARSRGRLDGTLDEVRRLLDTAIGQERAALFPDPGDEARLREAELDALPSDPARAVRELADYDWRSQQARETYDQISDLLRREVLDAQFRGMKQALQGATPDDLARVREMVRDLNDLLEADARGEETGARFEEFMRRHGEFFPENPRDLEELVDSLARRAAAAQRLLAGLTPAQRQELADLMATAMEDLGLSGEMSRLSRALQSARPDLDWGGRGRGRGRARGRFPEAMTGDEPLGFGDATSALEDLAELDELAAALSQDYPGASLDDVDPEAVERALGRTAVDDLRQLQQIERELERQGFITRRAGALELTPRAVRRIGDAALARIFREVAARGRGDHTNTDAGSAGDLLGTSRRWQFGDTQPIDVVRTVRNAVLRAGPPGPGRRVRLSVDDFEVAETERRTSAAVCLLVDLSYSMALRGTWGVAKSTALALHSLVTTRFPQDKVHIIGFSDYARELRPVELAGLDSEMVQGTNLQHALLIAGRLLRRYPESEPVIMVVTDGEPTAHLQRDGSSSFSWPPMPETLELTLAEVERLTRRGVTINVFMLDDEPRLVRFVEEMAQRNGGRVLSPDPATLGSYVIRDYLHARGARRVAR